MQIDLPKSLIEQNSIEKFLKGFLIRDLESFLSIKKTLSFATIFDKRSEGFYFYKKKLWV